MSSLRELAFRGEIPPDHAREHIRGLVALPIATLEPDGLRLAAWDVSIDLGWAKTYDAEYVALAMLLGCPVVSLDLRLQRGVRRLVKVLTPIEL